jgi:radical SAM superfamily enzyme YgiQ (UPF0313 family)
MKILLVYPQYPDTFWSFRYALKFISKKASFPPLGLLTVASMLPGDWEKKLVDMNTNQLTDEDIAWADFVFISAMVVQRDSVKEVISRCRHLEAKTVAGGPLFTTGYRGFREVDHLVLGEAEITLPLFIKDLEAGNPQRIYLSRARPGIWETPLPQWSLVNRKQYSSMSLQYSRGCPFNCEFCDIITLNGHRPRTKDAEQVIAELEALYGYGWRSGVFFVDDNFIGNKKKLKEEVLPAVIQWQKDKRYPFELSTEASINLADDETLMRMMVEAGFNRVFVGIETPNEESLLECNKAQNRNRDLVASVKKIQNHGLEVQGGFIVGFDSDPLSIFKSQINFIQNSGIVTAMVGLLNAPPGTRLYKRLKSENRLLKAFSGDNNDLSLNFIPKMNSATLINGYKQILDTIYSPKQYYERAKAFLREYRPNLKRKRRFQFYHVMAFLKSVWVLGLRDKGRKYYWRLFLLTLMKYPRKLPISISVSVYGYHFRKVVDKYISTPIENSLASRAVKKADNRRTA